jgi:hypothetical protein
MAEEMSYPRMQRVRQRFDGPRLGDVPGAVRAELERSGLLRSLRPGGSVAITVGSRGIRDIVAVVRTLAGMVRAAGALPFIVPAMGSHGGATAEGQRRIVEELGATEDAVGAPVRASMGTVHVGTTADGIPMHFDRCAHDADHVIVVGRVKPHTNFSGDIESGLLKMLVVGLGKHTGAALYHRAFVQHSFGHVVRTAGRELLARCRVAGGLAIVENADDETALVEAVPPAAFETRERELLVLAKRWMPRLPIRRPDLLIVDEMGKNISGSGMDTNVVGRKPHGTPDHDPEVRRLFVRELTAETHGNAYGIGIADFATSRLVRAIDYQTTIINCVTAAHPQAAAIPIHFETDRAAIDAALGTIGLLPPERARVVRIRNTLRLSEVEVSEACRTELAERTDVELVDPLRPLAFDESGNLPPLATA